MINLHQTDVAKYDFFSSTTKGTFWNWVEQEFPIQVKFYGNHINIEYFQTISTGEVYFHIVTVLCCGLRGYALRTTARQYGEVVLPDASTGQGPGTLATKLSRCKEGMAHFLQSRYNFF